MNQYDPRLLPARSAALVVATVMFGAAWLQPAFAGQEDTIHFRGHSTMQGCQGDVKVTFDVIAGSHGPKRVENFRATGLNYPNETTSETTIPEGEPGDLGCYPGGPILGSHNWLSYETYSSVIPFGQSLDPKGKVPRNLFATDNQFWANGLGEPTLLEEDRVWGRVKVVSTKKAKTTWRSRGTLLYATSEAGLKYGGLSTGDVDWTATAKSKSR